MNQALPAAIFSSKDAPAGPADNPMATNQPQLAVHDELGSGSKDGRETVSPVLLMAVPNDGTILSNGRGSEQQPTKPKSRQSSHKRVPFLDLTNWNDRSHPYFYDASRTAACRTIWRAWISYRNRRIFDHLKSLLLKSQTTLTLTLLKRLSPQEAQLLKDPVTQARVRFRFGGAHFPPQIHYKVYTTCSGALSTQYFSGTHLLLPHTRAARDAWTVMGNARYLRTVVGDDFALHRGQGRKVPPPADLTLATNPREAIQYLANLDHRSIVLGGRGNGWRVLDGWPVMGHVALYGPNDREVPGAAGGVQQAKRRALDRVRMRKKLGLFGGTPAGSKDTRALTWDATRGPVYTALSGGGDQHLSLPTTPEPPSLGGKGAMHLTRAEKEKAKRLRQIDKLRRLYLQGDDDNDERDGRRQDRLDHAVADLIGAPSSEGATAEEDEFGDLFTWSTGLCIDDYAF